MKNDRIHNIKPVWLRRLLTICLFAPFTFILIGAFWVLGMAGYLIYGVKCFAQWWWHDFVVKVWNGTDTPDTYTVLPFLEKDNKHDKI